MYDDQLNLPLRAIYYYQFYLDHAPNAADRATVVKWLATAEHKYYLKLKDEYNDPEDLRSLRYRLEIAREQLQQTQTQLTAAQNQSRRSKQQYQEQLGRAGDTADKAKAEILKLQHQQWENAYFISKLKKQLAEAKKAERNLTRDNNHLKLERQEQDKIVADLKQQLQQDAKQSSSADWYHTATGAEHNFSEGVNLSPPASPNQADAAGDGTDSSVAVPTAVTGNTGATTEQPPAPTDPTAAVQVSPPSVPASVGDRLAEPTFYKVKSGDTLIGISKQFYGTGKYYRQIIDANRSLLDSPLALRPDMVLKIPPRATEKPRTTKPN
ncbi:MAG: LysM peptidoglycan-binding domain-containing protein [Victivallales bacterium]|nr:LysM peptidoglycan-binding domain-containing protein [Victivallales bacterium]